MKAKVIMLYVKGRDHLGRKIVADLGGGRAFVERSSRNDDMILTHSINGQHWDSAAFDMEDAQRMYDALGRILRHYRGQDIHNGGCDPATGEPYPL